MKPESTDYLEKEYLATLYHCKPFDLRTAFYAGVEAVQKKPIDMLLQCPSCGTQHIDAPEPDICTCTHDFHWHYEKDKLPSGRTGCGDPNCECQLFVIAWDNPSHRSHLCHGCGVVWRPADVPTNGVASIETRGGKDTWPTRVLETELKEGNE